MSGEEQPKGVRVQIKLPAEAAERLRQMAESNDPNLAAMGIAGVMMGESGSLIPISGADGSALFGKKAKEGDGDDDDDDDDDDDEEEEEEEDEGKEDEKKKEEKSSVDSKAEEASNDSKEKDDAPAPKKAKADDENTKGED